VKISETDRIELLTLSHSESLRQDEQRVAAHRHDPFLVEDEVNTDRVMEFLNQYNEFLNHPIKLSRPFIESNMKL
jgi:hypothetical protein